MCYQPRKGPWSTHPESLLVVTRQCIFATLFTGCRVCVNVTADFSSMHPCVLVATMAGNNRHFSIWASAVHLVSQFCAMMTCHFLSSSLTTFPTLPTQSSPTFPFQNLPPCHLIPHSAAPPRACSVATAGVWTSSARPCPHVPAKMALYHATGSEGWACAIAPEPGGRGGGTGEQGEGVALACARHCLDRR